MLNNLKTPAMLGHHSVEAEKQQCIYQLHHTVNLWKLQHKDELLWCAIF